MTQRMQYLSVVVCLIFFINPVRADGVYFEGEGAQKRPTEILPEGTEVQIHDRSNEPAIYPHLREIGAAEYERKDLPYLTLIKLQGSMLGKVEKSLFDAQDKSASAEIVKFLTQQQEIFDSARDYSYKIESVNQSGDITVVYFSQVIDDVSLPESKMIIMPDGEVYKIELVSVDPKDPTLQKGNWIPEAKLIELGGSAYENEFGSFDPELVEGKHYVAQYDGQGGMIVLFRFQHGKYRIAVNANTGDIDHMMSLLYNYHRRCDNTGVLVGIRTCGLHPDTNIFFDNVCLGGSPRCTAPDVTSFGWAGLW